MPPLIKVSILPEWEKLPATLVSGICRSCSARRATDASALGGHLHRSEGTLCCALIRFPATRPILAFTSDLVIGAANFSAGVAMGGC
jgi:hypothetical protein